MCLCQDAGDPHVTPIALLVSASCARWMWHWIIPSQQRFSASPPPIPGTCEAVCSPSQSLALLFLPELVLGLMGFLAASAIC